MRPDFLIIPHIVQACPKLQPTDWIVYAVVYWYQHMRDGRCTASNKAIADVAGVGERSVRGALMRLEDAGFLRREWRDKKKKDRAQIICLVSYGLHEAARDEQKTPSLSKELAEPAPHVDTPGQYAKKFFDGEPQVVGELGKQLEDAGIPMAFVIREFLKFRNYWTEPNPSGKKQRWQMESTFDVKRRLGMWFRIAAERSSSGAKRSGAGSTV